MGFEKWRSNEPVSFSNPTKKPVLKEVTHKTFYSELIGHEIGYNIYLPPGYDGKRCFPVVYSLHGWTGNESSHIRCLKDVIKNREAITVFPNATRENGYRDDIFPIESMIITELIPHIDQTYKTIATRDGRAISGMSMGGAGAFYYAVKYHELFSAVTAYAPTFHHFFHDDYDEFDKPASRATEIFNEFPQYESAETKYFEANGIMRLLKQNADKIRSRLKIAIHIGTADILYCENELMHLYLDSLGITHEYRVFEGVGHKLTGILYS